MVKEFLKIAGVKTQAEFYKKYPSEEAFFKAHPEARNLVNQKMAYGGMYAYNRGGSYPAYQVGATVPPLMEQFENDPAMYQEALYNYVANQQQPTGVVPAGAPPVGTVSTPLPTEMLYNMGTSQPAASQYQGVSIVDMLASKGKSDFASRKEIAKSLGIKGYKGTADQNLQMINLLNQNPDILNQTSVPSSPRAASTSSATMVPSNVPEATENLNQFSLMDRRPKADNFNVQYPSSFNANTNESNDDNLVPLIIGALSTAAATGATGAGLINYNKLMDGINSGQYKFGKSAKAALTKSINKLKSGAVETAGKDIKVQADWYKKLPKQHQAILKSLDAAEIPGDIHIMPKGTASRDMYTRDMLNEANAEKMIASQYENQKALQEAEQEAAALRKARASKAAAARWGNKAAETEKALGLGSRIAKGARAFQNLKYVKPVGDFLRGLVKEDGGENNYSGTYSGGVYYQEGGAYIPEYGDNAYGVLPKYGMGAMGVPPAMYGMGMRDGGQNDLQNLINAGYNLDYLADGGPTYSKVTAYNHQGIVPAFDWLKEGGPTFSKHTGYPHQQYVPALDWLQEGGAPISPDAAQQQGPDPQQVMQAVSQMLQQGTEPGQILQELVKAGVPQEMAQQIIQQVMQQMQGVQQSQQAGPMMKSGGLVKGSIHDVSEEDVQDLINKGYKIQYL